MNTAYNNLYDHCALRAKERYNYTLSRGDFDTISLNIRKFKRPGIDIMLYADVAAKRNQHWIVEHKGKWFWVVYDIFVKFCITFMPLSDLSNKQIRISRGTRNILKQRGIWPTKIEENGLHKEQ
ncbi:MAG TPA: hypothetical protein P5509_04995 [Bacteroidales bacterium]|nr:hypothetical protein [Bacteroidales bacterium]